MHKDIHFGAVSKGIFVDKGYKRDFQGTSYKTEENEARVSIPLSRSPMTKDAGIVLKYSAQARCLAKMNLLNEKSVAANLKGLNIEKLPTKIFTLLNLRVIHFSNFKKLNLSSNQINSQGLNFTGCAPFMFLIDLCLADNQLEYIDSSLFIKLPNLVTLDISLNRFTSFPKNVAHLEKLKFLNVTGNLFCHLPHKLVLSKLAEIKIEWEYYVDFKEGDLNGADYHLDNLGKLDLVRFRKLAFNHPREYFSFFEYYQGVNQNVFPRGAMFELNVALIACRR